jgi:hypothetical protein
VLKIQLEINIHDFDLQIEISKIHPVLWNFIFRMTASEDEEKMLKKNTFLWENHYVKCSSTQRNLVDFCQDYQKMP